MKAEAAEERAEREVDEAEEEREDEREEEREEEREDEVEEEEALPRLESGRVRSLPFPMFPFSFCWMSCLSAEVEV